MQLTCSLSTTLTDPLCSPLSLYLFTAYITCILTALYTILRHLHTWYQDHECETQIEIAANQRLLQQQTESDMDKASSTSTDEWHTAQTCVTPGSGNGSGESVDEGRVSSGSRYSTITRTEVHKKAKGARYMVPAILDARYGTIAQRRYQRF